MRIQSINQNNYQNRNVEFKQNVHGIIDVSCKGGILKERCERNLGAFIKKKSIERGLIKSENCDAPYVLRGKDGKYHILVPDKSTESYRKNIHLNPYHETDSEIALEKVRTSEIDTVELRLPGMGREDKCPMEDPKELLDI